VLFTCVGAYGSSPRTADEAIAGPAPVLNPRATARRRGTPGPGGATPAVTPAFTASSRLSHLGSAG
jgi:hypothetical protein